jgi:hypothetical protein
MLMFQTLSQYLYSFKYDLGSFPLFGRLFLGAVVTVYLPYLSAFNPLRPNHPFHDGRFWQAFIVG